jgi:arylsulfatase A-like enzyme
MYGSRTFTTGSITAAGSVRHRRPSRAIPSVGGAPLRRWMMRGWHGRMTVKTEPKLSRRRLLGSAGAAAVVAAAPALALASGERRPNILFIMADDLGFADLSCYGRRDYSTPVLDRLASEGVLLTQAYASSPVCSPTRVALITGRYPQRLTVGLPEPIRSARLDPVGLEPDDGLLPQILKRAGYRAVLVGKWHMGWPPANGPIACGYDRFFGNAAGAVDYFSHREFEPGTAGRDGLYEGSNPVRRQGYLTDLLADRAIEEIASAAQAGQPLFLSLHFTAPHWPWQGPADAASGGRIPDLRHHDGGNLATYAAMVGSLDSAIGRVLAALDRQRLAENTIVIFTSDNGGERFSDTWPLRGGKGELLEGGIRAPALVRWPGRIPAGARSPQVTATIDWLPTLAAAAGATLDARRPPDGEDMLPVLTGAAPPRRRRLFWRFAQSNQAAVRDGDLKYLRVGDEEHCYNLAEDPRERADLKLREATAFARLREEFASWNATMLRYS